METVVMALDLIGTSVFALARTGRRISTEFFAQPQSYVQKCTNLDNSLA